MAKLRGSITSKLFAIRETLMLAVVNGQDHGDLIKMILGIIESIDKELLKKQTKADGKK
jgi:hypothetical protein